MKVLVFGGAGFLGSYVVDELVNRGYEVAVFDLLDSLYANGDARTIVGSILDEDSVRAAVAGQDAVYNFAGLADLNDSIDKPVETVQLNVMGNLNILEACRHEKVNRFIYTVIRYGSVYGERGDANNRIDRILRQALTEGRITFPGDGSEEREYIHGRDAAKLSTDVLESDKYLKQNVILTGIERFKYTDLLSFIKEMMNDEIDIEMLGQDYKGHYVLTPYSFTPSIGVKLVNNPSIDFGQGLLECINQVFNELQVEGVLDGTPVPAEYSE